MKKLFIALALAGICTASMAQDTEAVPTKKYSVATNSFWSNWFVQAGFQWSAWYSSEEHGQGLARSPFKKFRSNPGASIAIGKWFTPGLGLRTKLSGIWGKTVTDGDNAGNGNKYWTLHEQVLFNLSNMFCGYNPNRVWNFVPFAGYGLSRSCTYNMYSVGWSFGILNQFYVNKKFAINFEIGLDQNEKGYDGIEANYGKGGWETHDNHVYAEVGFTYNLGKATWEKVPDVDAIMAQNQAALDALNAKLADANAENERLRNMLSSQKPSQSAKEFVNTPVSVFFNIGKSTIASKKDLVNVQALAKYAKDNNSNLLVTGYADSKTGSAEYNQKLSEKRAETVANEIVNMGVDKAKIQTLGKGGVETLSPISFNRRATVQVSE